MSIVRAVWSFTDAESAVHDVTWSVRVHHDYHGHQPVDPVYVTSASEGIKPDVRLYDGDKYFLTLLACNGAGICTLDAEVRDQTLFAANGRVSADVMSFDLRLSHHIQDPSSIVDLNSPGTDNAGCVYVCRQFPAIA